jgi:hypothetical protein
MEVMEDFELKLEWEAEANTKHLECATLLL